MQCSSVLTAGKMSSVCPRLCCILVVALLTPPLPARARPAASLVWCYWAVMATSGCRHGDMAGPCGRVCLRGPGQLCGGLGGDSRYGLCGPGLVCTPSQTCARL